MLTLFTLSFCRNYFTTPRCEPFLEIISIQDLATDITFLATSGRCKRAPGTLADRPFFQWMDLEPNTAVWIQRFGTNPDFSMLTLAKLRVGCTRKLERCLHSLSTPRRGQGQRKIATELVAAVGLVDPKEVKGNQLKHIRRF